MYLYGELKCVAVDNTSDLRSKPVKNQEFEFGILRQAGSLHVGNGRVILL